MLCAPNSPELAIAYFAVHAAGGVAVLLDADVPAESLAWIAEDAEARLALVGGKSTCRRRSPTLTAWCGEGSEVGEQRSESRGQRSEVADPTLEIGFPTSDLRLPTSDSAADLIYTTGTTGRKKGVLLTHRSIAQAALNINAFVGTCRDDLEVMPLPLSHSFGLGRLRAMALAGHCLLLLPGMRNPATVLKQLLDAKATGLALVPAGFDLILRMTRDRLGDAREHLRYIEIGSAAMRPETRQKLLDLLPRTRICHHYGLTEASRAAFLEYHADHDHLASIGRPSPNVEMAVRDDEGHDLTDGQEGEICVRGGMVMQQYWKQPELTRDALRRREGDRHPPCDAQESLSDVAWGFATPSLRGGSARATVAIAMPTAITTSPAGKAIWSTSAAGKSIPRKSSRPSMRIPPWSSRPASARPIRKASWANVSRPASSSAAKSVTNSSSTGCATRRRI